MGLTDSLKNLTSFWATKNIKLSSGCTVAEISVFENRMNLKLPLDIRQYYRHVNGMLALYPNDTDDEGFLFYPLSGVEVVVRNEERFSSNPTLIFVDFMHRSWSYYISYADIYSYEIGIHPTKGEFKSITNSLDQFIDYYLSDDEILYTY